MTPMRKSRGLLPRRAQLVEPGVVGDAQIALRQQVQIEAGGAARGRFAHGREPERRMRLAHRLGRDVDRPQTIVLPRERERRLGPGAAHHRDALLGERYPVGAPPPERLELLVAVAHAEAEHHATAGEHVDGGDVLRQLERVVERQQQDVGRELHLLRARRDRGQQWNRRRRVAVLGEVVLGDPDRVEAELLGAHDLFSSFWNTSGHGRCHCAGLRKS